MDAGVIPVKALDRAKRRLATRFADADRARIARALLDDALELCTATPFVEWWVVSDDDAVLTAAAERGVRTERDRGTGLNDAVTAGVAAAIAAGAASVTVVPGDAPLARAEDVRDLIDTGATSDVVAVPARRDGGTNGLYVRPPDLIAPRFGERSLDAHVRQAERLRVRCSILALPRLALDLDAPDDVDELLAHPGAGDTVTGSLLTRLARED